MGHDSSQYDIFRASLPDDIKDQVKRLSLDMGVSQRKIYEQAIIRFVHYRQNHSYSYKDYEPLDNVTSIRMSIDTKKKFLAIAKHDEVTARKVMCSAVDEYFNRTYQEAA